MDRANTEIGLQDGKHSHEKYMNKQVTCHLNNIADQSKELSAEQVQLQAEANEADQIARKDDERYAH